MKIVRHQTAIGEAGYGREHLGGMIIRIQGKLCGRFSDMHQVVQIAKRLVPVEPRGIICIGLNYRQHAAEGNQPITEWPVVFMKNSGTLQYPGDSIVLPRNRKSDAIDYECELAVVFGKDCYNISRPDALNYFLGCPCVNYVSARDWQIKRRGNQWCRGQTFATCCPLGLCLVTNNEIPNPNTLRLRTILNGQTLQVWNTDDMIFDVPTLIECLSGSTRLAAGTVVLTGTPHAVGAVRKPPVFLRPGERVTIESDGIGSLTKPVIAEEAIAA